jgi:hypothetical protein
MTGGPAARPPVATRTASAAHGRSTASASSNACLAGGGPGRETRRALSAAIDGVAGQMPRGHGGKAAFNGVRREVER